MPLEPVKDEVEGPPRFPCRKPPRPPPRPMPPRFPLLTKRSKALPPPPPGLLVLPNLSWSLPSPFLSYAANPRAAKPAAIKTGIPSLRLLVPADLLNADLLNAAFDAAFDAAIFDAAAFAATAPVAGSTATMTLARGIAVGRESAHVADHAAAEGAARRSRARPRIEPSRRRPPSSDIPTAPKMEEHQRRRDEEIASPAPSLSLGCVSLLGFPTHRCVFFTRSGSILFGNE